MERVTEALLRLANALDRMGLVREADEVGGIARRAVLLLKTPPPKDKEEFLGHIIERMPGNLLYMHGPLLMEKSVHALLLGDRKREIERRHKAFEELAARLPGVERAPNGGPIEIILPGGLAITISEGTVSATADPRNPQASALAKSLTGKPADPSVLRTIGREAPRTIPSEPPAETAPTPWRHPAEEERQPGAPPPEADIARWTNQLAQGQALSMPLDLLRPEDLDTRKDSDLKARFRARLSKIWEFQPKFAVEDRVAGDRLELRRFDRTLDNDGNPYPYEIKPGTIEEEWLRIPDHDHIRTDAQIDQDATRTRTGGAPTSKPTSGSSWPAPPRPPAPRP